MKVYFRDEKFYQVYEARGVYNIILTLSMLGKIFSRRHFEIILLFRKTLPSMQMAYKESKGDNLHRMSKSIF